MNCKIFKEVRDALDEGEKLNKALGLNSKEYWEVSYNWAGQYFQLTLEKSRALKEVPLVDAYTKEIETKIEILCESVKEKVERLIYEEVGEFCNLVFPHKDSENFKQQKELEDFEFSTSNEVIQYLTRELC